MDPVLGNLEITLKGKMGFNHRGYAAREEDTGFLWLDGPSPFGGDLPGPCVISQTPVPLLVALRELRGSFRFVG